MPPIKKSASKPRAASKSVTTKTTAKTKGTNTKTPVKSSAKATSTKTVMPKKASSAYLPPEMKDIEKILEKYAKAQNYNFSTASARGRTFERFVADVFKANGYVDAKFTKNNTDFGVDIIMKKKVSASSYFSDDEYDKIAIECKYRPSSNVGDDTIMKLVGGMVHYGCNKGIVVTVTNFTPAAIEGSKGKHINLINGKKLSTMMKKFKI